ncbi:MAG: TIGR00730 family Rossman fold protein, partial [Bacteroidales bacterium]|nr:TIGR00730 family Rossman fold protein [Bacteroidales bacterium]
MINKELKSIGVFCGSCMGTHPVYAQKAGELGTLIASQNMRLVYGGGAVGLMSTLADAVLEGRGTVIGVLPHFLDKKEIAHSHITEMLRVNSMSERKDKIIELSDAFIALAGGYGTCDELFEVLVGLQLGLHRKPIGILNTNGFYDPLFQQLSRMKDEGFLNKNHHQMLV